MKIKARVRAEVGDQSSEGRLYRVRHARTGLYVSGEVLDENASAAVRLRLVGKPGGLVLLRRKAACVADAWIALTGDAGVEIEPSEGDGIPS